MSIFDLEQNKRIFKECTRCGRDKSSESFAQTRSYFFPDGYIPICNSCLLEFLRNNEWDWAAVDKICQMVDVPFIPNEWEKVKDLNKENELEIFPKYSEIFLFSQYDGLGWDIYYQEFKELKEEGMLHQQVPLLNEQRIKELKIKWGFNYSEEQLYYLENLEKGILATQNVSGALQGDQALKLCKISEQIDSRIREGADFDKLLSSYDKLIKAAEFTPKNAKNANDFESVGEIFTWFEKRGWKNPYYDGVVRDEVDATIKNIQLYNQKLYLGESSIGEDITRRLDALRFAQEMEEDDYYGINQSYDLESYETEEFLIEGEDEFNPEVDSDE